MKRLFAIMLAFILIGVMSYSQDKNIVGTWNGKLEVGGIDLRLTFNISDTSGALTATMDSPDQGAFDIPMDNVIFENDTVRIVTAALVGEYLAVLTEDGNTLDDDGNAGQEQAGQQEDDGDGGRGDDFKLFHLVKAFLVDLDRVDQVSGRIAFQLVKAQDEIVEQGLGVLQV